MKLFTFIWFIWNLAYFKGLYAGSPAPAMGTLDNRIHFNSGLPLAIQQKTFYTQI